MAEVIPNISTKDSLSKFYSSLFRSIVLISILYLFCGCSIPVACALYNNTKSTISITIIDNDGSKKVFSVNSGMIIKLQGWTLHNYEIALNGKLWEYDPPLPPEDYIVTTGFGPWVQRFVYVQLEQDGIIYLVSKVQKPPISTMSKQPTGYPLLPEKTWGRP